MKNVIEDKIKILKKSNSKILKEPIAAIKKLNFQKLNIIKSFSINKTLTNFKEKLRKAELERIKTLKKNKINKLNKKNINNKNKN